MKQRPKRRQGHTASLRVGYAPFGSVDASPGNTLELPGGVTLTFAQGTFLKGDLCEATESVPVSYALDGNRKQRRAEMSRIRKALK